MPEQPTPARRDLHGPQCREVLAQLELFLDAECAAELERSIRQHLRACPPCLHRADFAVELKAVIADRCSEPAPAGLVEKVIARLRAASSGGTTAGGTA